MHRPTRRGLVACLLAAGLSVLVGTSFSRTAQAVTPAENVASQLKAMNTWLGTGKAGDGWRGFLLNEQLVAQLAMGADADREVVASILEKYNSKTPGLDRPQFTAVQAALDIWLAELKLPKRDELPAFARAFKERYQPITDEQLTASRAKLKSAAGQLTKYLRPGSKGHAGWSKYLKLNDLTPQMASDAEPDLKVLVDSYRALTADTPGLELNQFTDVSDALLAYIDLVAVKNMENAQEQYEQQIDTLSDSLEKYAAAPSEEENFNIGRRLGELAVGRQANDLIQAVRRYHSQPNLMAEFSKPLVEVGLAREVNRPVDITDNILGAYIRGSGQLSGKVGIELVPNEKGAMLQTVLTGKINTNTTGNKSGVTFYSRGVTTFTATKNLVMTPEGLVAKSPQCSAVTDNNVYNLSAGRIASRVAWDQVAANRAQGNYIAARHAEDRIKTTFNAEAAPMLQKASGRFLEKFRHPLVRMREFPEVLNFSTTKDRVEVVGLKANRFQIGAPGEPPALGDHHDMSIRVHESFAANFAAAVWAGKTLTDEQVKERVIAWRGSLPDEMKDDEDQDPWSITFARHKPITLILKDQGFEITIRGQQYTSGEREFRAMNVTAVYKMELAGSGVKMTRQGDLKIEPPDFAVSERRLSASEVALKTILERKFGKLFKPEIVSEGLELPGNWKKAGKLRPVELTANDGWLTIGWEMPSKDVVADSATEAETK